MKQAVEMTAHGKPGKRYNCFPPFPQALEIKERFPHYHRHDEYLDEQIFHLRTPKNCPNYRSRRRKRSYERVTYGLAGTQDWRLACPRKKFANASSRLG